MSVELPRDARQTHVWPRPGEWAIVRRTDRADGPTAFVTCPHCGDSASLSGHSIDASGRVTPSLVCPTDGCSWHVHVTLVGWAAALAEKPTG